MGKDKCCTLLPWNLNRNARRRIDQPWSHTLPHFTSESLWKIDQYLSGYGAVPYWAPENLGNDSKHLSRRAALPFEFHLAFDVLLCEGMGGWKQVGICGVTGGGSFEACLCPLASRGGACRKLLASGLPNILFLPMFPASLCWSQAGGGTINIFFYPLPICSVLLIHLPSHPPHLSLLRWIKCGVVAL